MARYDPAFPTGLARGLKAHGAGSGGMGFFVENPKDIRSTPAFAGQALAEAMNHRGPALVNVVISQGAARKPQQFRRHS
jgi:hypothetical protein